MSNPLIKGVKSLGLAFGISAVSISAQADETFDKVLSSEGRVANVPAGETCENVGEALLKKSEASEGSITCIGKDDGRVVHRIVQCPAGDDGPECI